MRNCRNVPNYIFGRGTFGDFPELLNQKRSGNDSAVVFFVDDFFKAGELAKGLPLGPSDCLIFLNVDREPYAQKINELVHQIKSDNLCPVALVGIGGGSVLDYTKAVSVLLTNYGRAEDYQGWDLAKNPGVYKIGIPTISGTGAETTRTAIFQSEERKLGINSEYSMFDQLVLDPELLKSVPDNQFFYTGMDCYIHCVEALRGNVIDAMSRSYAEKSLRLCTEVFLHDADWDDLMVASYFGGYAMANSNVGICHPLSYGLSLVLHLHHGIANCIAFAHLAEYYAEEVKVYEKMLDKISPQIPKVITDDVTEEDLDRMVEAVLKNDRPLNNAFGEQWRTVFTPKKVKELLKKM